MSHSPKREDETISSCVIARASIRRRLRKRVNTYEVRTAMRAEVGSKSNAAHEEEQDVERICDDHEHGRHGELLLDGGHNEVEQ